MTATICSLCKKDPATGTAFINDDRYCHGDGDREPTCYQVAQWRRSFGETLHGIRSFLTEAQEILGLKRKVEHRSAEEPCICTGEAGGGIYTFGCPRHDPSVKS